jgi:hypothetical protein
MDLKIENFTDDQFASVTASCVAGPRALLHPKDLAQSAYIRIAELLHEVDLDIACWEDPERRTFKKACVRWLKLLEQNDPIRTDICSGASNVSSLRNTVTSRT